MRYVASSGERHVTIELEENGHRRHATLDDTSFEVDWQAVGGALLRAVPGAAEGHYSLLIGERSFDCYVRSVPRDEAGSHGGEQLFEVELAGQTYHIRLQDERTRTLAGLAASHDHGDAPITAPMPGLVSNILAEVGQQVERGQTVIVLEAMKMENDLGAPRAGVVRAIKVARGQTVNQAQVLAVIGDAEGASAAGSSEDEDSGA
jgi:biotin carboxyl carrier protein